MRFESILDIFCGACTFLTAEVAILNDFVLPTSHFSGEVTVGWGSGGMWWEGKALPAPLVWSHWLSYFGGLSIVTKLKLLRLYRSSFTGCDLWDLSNNCMGDFCVTWSKSVKRVWDLSQHS